MGHIFNIILLLIVAIIHTSFQQFVSLDQRQATCTCGAVNRRTRIIGGQETEINEYPWMAQIFVHSQEGQTFKPQQLCGAAIISSNFVVSAAHCFSKLSAKDLTIDCGDHDLRTTTETTNVYRNVSQLIIHEKYNNITHVNDIALLKLITPLTFNKNIQPACLPPLQLDIPRQTITVTGYGATNEGGGYNPVLNEVDLPVIPLAQCKAAYADKDAVIDKSVVCAGVPDGSKDACQGDSGSPAVLKCNSVHSLVGVVSLGVGCGNPAYPGVFTNVSHFRDWIVTKAVGADMCIYNCYPTPVEDTDCGWANVQSRRKRVVGGAPTAENQYPWMCAVYIKINGVWSFSCAAVLIDKQWALTTARCVNATEANTMLVFGTYNINVINAAKEQVFSPVQQIIRHPQYSTSYFYNDIALVKLPKSAIYTDWVKPICVPAPNTISSNFSNVNLNLLGWGRTSVAGNYSGPLKEVIVKAIDNALCEKYHGSVIQPSMVCTESKSTADACEGDNGGPLMTKGKSGRHYVAALNSFRSSLKGCGGGYPAGNTRISHYNEWIQTTTGVKIVDKGDKLLF